MKLSTKFSLLLSATVLGSVLSTAYFLGHSFASDQESYLAQSHGRRVLFVATQLQNRFRLLHAQAEGLSHGGHFAKTLREGLSDVCEVTVEKGTPGSFPSLWTLVPGEGECFVWLGRLSGGRFVRVSLKRSWIEELWPSEEDTSLSILGADGRALLGSDVTPPERSGVVYTARVGGEQLVTTLKLEEGVTVALVSPLSVVWSVVQRTFRYVATVASVAIVLSILIGVAFSTTLTQPIRDLVSQTLRIAQGHFDITLARTAGRRDEVGDLTRAFAKMGTDLKKAQETLRHNERMATLGQFSASIAHEIRNPIAGSLGNLQLAEEETRDPQEAESLRERLGLIREELLRANRVVTSLLRYSRQEKLELVDMDLSARVERTLRVLEGQLKQQGAQLESRIEPGIFCRGEGDRLHEVLMNLIQNSIHAVQNSPEKTIRVSLRRDGDEAILEVEDSGPGLAAGAKEHLFEPFFTTKPVGQGTGLGLAISYGIVSAHRGSIEVCSGSLSGACFRLRLPALRGHALAA